MDVQGAAGDFRQLTLRVGEKDQSPTADHVETAAIGGADMIAIVEMTLAILTLRDMGLKAIEDWTARTPTLLGYPVVLLKVDDHLRIWEGERKEIGGGYIHVDINFRENPINHGRKPWWLRPTAVWHVISLLVERAIYERHAERNAVASTAYWELVNAASKVGGPHEAGSNTEPRFKLNTHPIRAERTASLLALALRLGRSAPKMSEDQAQRYIECGPVFCEPRQEIADFLSFYRKTLQSCGATRDEVEAASQLIWRTTLEHLRELSTASLAPFMVPRRAGKGFLPDFAKTRLDPAEALQVGINDTLHGRLCDQHACGFVPNKL